MVSAGDSGTIQAHMEPVQQPFTQPQTSQVAAELGLSLKPVKVRPSQQTTSLTDPIQLPATPSGHPFADTFHLHKTRLEPVKTRLAPLPHPLAPAWPLGLSSEAQGWSLSAPGPVTEGAEALVDGVSDAGSSEAESSDQPARWGMFQAAKQALFRRKSQVPSCMTSSLHLAILWGCCFAAVTHPSLAATRWHPYAMPTHTQFKIPAPSVTDTPIRAHF